MTPEEVEKQIGDINKRLSALETTVKASEVKPLTETIDEHRGKLSALGVTAAGVIAWLIQMWLLSHPAQPVQPVNPPAKVAPMQEAKP